MKREILEETGYLVDILKNHTYNIEEIILKQWVILLTLSLSSALRDHQRLLLHQGGGGLERESVLPAAVPVLLS